ncbi:MAG TPA: trehalose-phosphatase [Candidatus Acidoferrales bacterium]|nr:trehalose-phosphatase [Candidatus Acidoferrales bacterium]
MRQASPSGPRHALLAWPEIGRRLAGSGAKAVFLDFDGTLARLRRRPWQVRCPARVKRLLTRLVRHRNLWLVVVSGRRSQNLRELIGVAGIHYLGAYGAELGSRPPEISLRTRRALAGAKRGLTAQFASLPGIWIEDKGLGLAIHCRAARSASLRQAAAALRGALLEARGALRLIAGTKIWELLPREFAGKGAAVRAVMDKLPPGTPGVYIGDDAADESAFAALPGGITVRVGRARNTRARYFLRSPAEVAEFLARLEEALQ